MTDGRAVQKHTKKAIPSRDNWNTNGRADLNETFLKWMTQTRQQIASLNWKCYTIEKKQLKKIHRPPGKLAERAKAHKSRNSSVEKSGTRVCARVRIALLSENVLDEVRQNFQLSNSPIQEYAWL